MRYKMQFGNVEKILLGWEGANAAVRYHLIRLYFKDESRSSLLTTNIASLAFLSTIWNDVSKLYLCLFLLANFLAGSLTRLNIMMERRNPVEAKDPAKTALRVLIVECGYGIVWAAGMAMMYPSGTGFGRSVLLIFALLGVLVRVVATIPGIFYARGMPVAVSSLYCTFMFSDLKVFFATLVGVSFVILRGKTIRQIHLSLRRQIELRMELEERSDELNHANAVRDRFLASVSHDLRTPLQGIIGMAKIIRKSLAGDPEAVERSKIIEQSGRSLQVMVEDILDIAGKRARPSNTPRQVFSVISLIENIVGLNAERIDEQGGELRYEIDGAVPKWIEADEYKLHRILHNLVSNARRYAPGTPIDIAVSVGVPEIDGKDGNLKIDVRDEGPGIPAERQDAVFEEFVRLRKSADEIAGTGLGLAVCRQLISNLGGTIDLLSDGETGCQFTVNVPFATATEPAEMSEYDTHDEVANIDGNVLLIEDIKTNQIVIGTYLTDMGFYVVVAETAAEAEIEIQRWDFDYILMDINLPDMNGVDLIRRIRADPDGRNRATPVLAVTANAGSDDLRRYHGAGFDVVLTKPIDPQELWNVFGFQDEPITTFSEQDPDQYADLVKTYCDVSPPIIDEIEACFEQGDATTLKSLSHYLASLSSNFDLPSMMDICGRIETAAEKNDLDDMGARIEELKAAHTDAMSALDIR